jgi:hypothetical protein
VTSIPITLEQAAEALRAAAVDGTVHELCFTARGEILSQHKEVEDVIDDLTYVQGGCLAFEAGPFGHDLAALIHGLIFRYRVPMPVGRVPRPAKGVGGVDMRVRIETRRRFLELIREGTSQDMLTGLANTVRAERGLPPVSFPQWLMNAHALKYHVPDGDSESPEALATACMFIAVGLTEEDGQ